MKYILSLIISGALVVSGFGQTRNVLVGTNNTVVQPTNFWSADASNARSGLGLGSAATNLASAFQPSSSVLSNLSSSNAINLTNLRSTNIVGTFSISQGGTGSTNASDARTALGLGTAATNLESAFQPASSTLTNLANNNGGNLTNITITNVTGLLATNGNGAGITNLTAANINGTVGLASNVSGVVAITNGGTGATNAATARTNLGLGWSALTNTNAATTLLGFTTNGQVVYSGTNALNFTSTVFLGNYALRVFSNTVEINTPLWFGDAAGTNIFEFEDTANAAIARTNLGLGWSALTNTNSGISLVSVDTNGSVVSPTNFWQQAPIATTVAFSTTATNSTNTATNSRNLIIQSLSSNIVNTTNTLLLPTNTSTFNGDTAVVIHAGGSGSATAIRQAGQTSNLIVLTNFDHAVRFLYFNNTWDFYHNIAYVEPIYFSGTNAAANAAASRTNLSLGWSALTNTNVTNFRTAIGLGLTNDVTFYSISASASITSPYIESSYFFITDGGSINFEDTGTINFGSTAPSVRANLDLSLPALTNTNNANFQAAVFTTNAAPTNSANVNTVNFNTAVAWIQITVSTNGTNHNFRIPLFQ